MDPTSDDDQVSPVGPELDLADPEAAFLAPVQRKIKEQLSAQVEEARLTLKERRTELKRLEAQRESVGVELYNAQQSLARNQSTLEGQDSQLEAVAALRREKESRRESTTAQHETVRAEADRHRADLFRYQAELDRLNETLTRVEKFNQQLSSEIAIERRSAFKEAAAVSSLEKEKDRQDDFVATLEGRVRRLEDALAVANGQLAVQRGETSAAKETLSEAISEMESIKVHRTRLLSEWNAAVIAVSRRDEALRAAEAQLQKQKEALQAIDNEISGVKMAISDEQNRNQRLTATLNRGEAEMAALLRKKDTTAERLAAAQTKYDLLKRSLETTNRQLSDVALRLKETARLVDAKAKEIATVTAQTNQLEASRLEILSSQKSLQKGSQAGLDSVRKARQLIREKELVITEAENQLARLRVDTLQTYAHNATLRESLASLNADIGEKGKLIELMELDIRRKNDEIQRRQKDLDNMNRQLEQTLARQGGATDGGVGPLEACIASLSKSITETAKANDDLQREWVRAQTELVASKNKHQQLEEQLVTHRAQAGVLRQKQLRLERESEAAKADIALVQRELNKLHREQGAVNEQLAQNTGKQEAVASDAITVEGDLVRRLMTQKQEAVSLEERIASVREEKRQLLEDLLEQERQAAYWHRKLQVAKETEAALDPSTGREEVTRMQQEITYMEQRAVQLRKQKNEVVASMVKDVEYGDTLRVKEKAVASSTKKGLTKAAVERENARLEHEVRQKKAEAARREQAIKDTMVRTESVGGELARLKEDVAHVQSEIARMQHMIATRMSVRDIRKRLRQRKQDTLTRLRDAEKGSYRSALRAERHGEAKAAHRQKIESVKDCVAQLRSEFPQYESALSPIIQSL